MTFIIASSWYSRRIARLCREYAVQVLATLFHLSYAKLLRVTITVFEPTYLLKAHRVWHYDANIAYRGKRRALLMFTALLLFVVFFIPYTLILFAIQRLQPFSHYKVFGWINQFKPLFDTYTGPYKDKHCYWTGLLLLDSVRIALFTVFSTNTSGDPPSTCWLYNCHHCLPVCWSLQSVAPQHHGVFLLLNLIILSVGVLYVTSIETNQYMQSLRFPLLSLRLFVTLIIIAYMTYVLKT